MWSGGDYKQNTSNINVNAGLVELYNEGTNGDYSIHLVADQTINCYIICYDVYSDNNLIDKTAIFTADIYTPNNACLLQLYDGLRYLSVNLPQNNTFEKVVIQSTLTKARLSAYINIFKEIDCYIDNVSLVIK